MKRVIVGVVLALIVCGRLTAEAPAPTLTDLQKLQLVNALKDVEIAQLKLQAVIAAVTPAGYRLTERMELEPIPAKTTEKP